MPEGVDGISGSFRLLLLPVGLLLRPPAAPSCRLLLSGLPSPLFLSSCCLPDAFRALLIQCSRCLLLFVFCLDSDLGLLRPPLGGTSFQLPSCGVRKR